MDVKKIVIILVGIVIIAFGIGIFSLRYNDNFNPITINDGKSLLVRSSESDVNISWDGIEVKDGDDHVSIGWDGIYVNDGNNRVDIGWKRNSKNLQSVNADVHLVEELTGVKEIVIYSPFIDIDVVTEDRDDVDIDYSGSMNINSIPSLNVDRRGNKLNIKLDTWGDDVTVTNLDALIRVSIPESFDGNISLTTSSADVMLTLGLDSNYKITGSSSSGDFMPNSEMDVTHNSNRSFQAIMGTGENTIEITTSSGDVIFQTP